MIKVKKIKKIRDKAIKKAIVEYMKRKKRMGKDFGWNDRGETDTEIAGKFCVQHWSGKEFDCECKKLGIKIEKILYF